MLKLNDKPKVKKEILLYKKVIEKIENLSVKSKAENLLKELEHQIRIINASHDPITNADIDPKRVRDNVEKMISIRKQLQQIVKDSK